MMTRREALRTCAFLPLFADAIQYPPGITGIKPDQVPVQITFNPFAGELIVQVDGEQKTINIRDIFAAL